ncbi:unnamed protein product [Lactuca virosa]|uniref:Uncharacterized protein n=1 Tax=Lactuca virosa TaxID=75947 RepID=A0AAU9LDC2_9ASTR|nr:unnamed protein product [Lactuca virosa]
MFIHHEGKIESSVVVIDQPTKHLSPSPKIEFHLSFPSSGCNRIGFLIIGYNLSMIFQIIKVFDLCVSRFEFDGGEVVTMEASLNRCCKAIVIERLPSGVFADPFELQHLTQLDGCSHIFLECEIHDKR